MKKEITIDGECLLWPAVKDKDGYGRVKINGKMKYAHRIALEIKIGRKLKSGEVAMHLCNNPQCYAAKHLKVGTVLENSQMRRAAQSSLADKLLKGWTSIYGDGSGYG